MKRSFTLLVFCIAVLLGTGVAGQAGIRSPGKYCGMAIFDRWDGCTLYSGIYVMYVSEKTKEGLRKYAGQAVQIDAKEVHQPGNPGDGLIGKFEYLGPAPADRNWVAPKGLHLESSVSVRDDGKAVATITIENKGKESVKLFSQELALTLFMKGTSHISDGPSYALITRQNFEIGGSEPRWEGSGFTDHAQYYWTIGKKNALAHDFTLAAGEKKQIHVQFDLPDGEYDFLCGYGGGTHSGKCLASNLSAFDVRDDKAKIVKIKSR